MKYLILSLLVFAVGCDTPTRSRFPGTSGAQQIADPFTGIPGTVTPVPPVTPTTPVTPGFETCNLTSTQSNADVGSVGVCKSTLDASRIRFVTSVSVPSTNKICIVPSFRNSTGNTTYIGDPECLATTAGTIYSGQLFKTRPNYTNSPMNALTIMREAIIMEYFACMDGYDWYIRNEPTGYCRNYPTNSGCVQAATNHRNTQCSIFSQKYPNSYLVIGI